MEKITINGNQVFIAETALLDPQTGNIYRAREAAESIARGGIEQSFSVLYTDGMVGNFNDKLPAGVVIIWAPSN